MGVEKVVTVICDFPGCPNGKKGPAILQWNETRVGDGQEKAPDAANYLVFSSHNGHPKTFCCQLCASGYFLPPGWNLVQEKVQTLPVEVATTPKENGLCKCGHPLDIHNHYGCTWVMSNQPGDFCKCEVNGDPT